MDIDQEGVFFSFIHISDIHFNFPYCCDKSMDTSYPIRMELLDDVQQVLIPGKKVDAIFVTGDIAYKAHPDEYKAAQEWLAALAKASGCKPSEVYTVPGNHDIDRECAKAPLVEAVRNSISMATDKHNLFRRSVLDKNSLHELIRPLEKYDVFAASYGCEISGEKPFWVHEIPLKHGWFIRVNGLNSTIFSGPIDDKPRERLFVGEIQYNFSPEDGAIEIALIHHPCDWLIDHDKIREKIADYCKILLVGHRHQSIPTHNGQFAEFNAGAVNPDDRELRWEPAYNYVTLSVRENAGSYFLDVEGRLRKWQTNPGLFCDKITLDRKNIFRSSYELRRPPRQPLRTETEEMFIEKKDEVNSAQAGEEKMPRDFILSFWSLSASERWRIVTDMGFAVNSQPNISEVDRYKAFFKSAQANNKMDVLITKVQEIIRSKEK